MNDSNINDNEEQKLSQEQPSQEQPSQEKLAIEAALNALPPQIRRLIERPALYLFLTPEGDVEFGTNLPDLDAHRSLAYLQIAAFKLQLQIMADAESLKEKKRLEGVITTPGLRLR